MVFLPFSTVKKVTLLLFLKPLTPVQVIIVCFPFIFSVKSLFSLKYPNLFEYDKVIYINSRIKVLIYSKLCDEYFYVLPSHLLCGQIKKKYLIS